MNRKAVQLKAVQLKAVQLKAVQLKAVQLKAVQLKAVQLKAVQLSDQPCLLLTRPDSDRLRLIAILPVIMGLASTGVTFVLGTRARPGCTAAGSKSATSISSRKTW